MLMISFLMSLAMSVEPSFRSPDDFQRWLTYYYLTPRPELVLPSIAFLDKELQKTKGRSIADESGRGGIRTFYAKVLEGNPDVVRQLSSALPGLPAGQQKFARDALIRCGSDLCLKAAGGPSLSAPRIVSGPDTLDDSWAAFLATGEDKYVLEVIEALPWVEVRGDVDRLVTGGAAKWSLESNAYQHRRVLAACEKAAAQASQPTRRLLLEIISNAKTQRAKTPPSEPK